MKWCGPRLPHRTDGVGASRLVDVRLNPVSRVRGFSKNRLRERLEASGLVYEHRPELGNPKNNRAGYAARDTGRAPCARPFPGQCPEHSVG
ncbi:DUF488 domain-containing protein [Actinomyces oricola]